MLFSYLVVLSYVLLNILCSISFWLKKNIQLFCIGRCIIVIITFFCISLLVYILFYIHNKDIIIIIIIIELEQHDLKILKLKHRFSYIKETGSVYTYEYMFIIALPIFTFKFIRMYLEPTISYSGL